MHIISRKKINEFTKKYPETRSALKEWYQRMKTEKFNSITELKTIFPSADKVGKLTVFNRPMSAHLCYPPHPPLVRAGPFHLKFSKLLKPLYDMAFRV